MRARILTALLMLSVLALPAGAQELSISLGEDGSLAGRGVLLILLVTVLSLAPGLAIMVTCFPFIVTVLAILRQAIGLQQSPPNMLLVSLALFLTYFVMEPTFTTAWQQGIQPMVEESLPVDQAIPRVVEPFRGFMTARVDGDTYAALAALRPGAAPAPGTTAPLSILTPAFLLTEIARAFQIGFLIYLPFLIIDLVTAAVLMSMGMMMVPPVMVALPFKLAFFVVADGWTLLSEALVRGYFPTG
ncbi:flagellar type III secretion system pore protein FliP [Rhodovulum adriaticum]|uniref:Flagellar biosynthetic protein FliP n=1 Tax=Rhodovulum adriaticum TaxID=35804 RepID=A0A4R2NZK9_RHOAD|nr:flagellar type III secretion system pore protein FliP [Rhodovulum adriaticum]MBK1634783.1 flagellar biosynthetic protein FliP [Rhodovulum adriaticum]TCP27642.1 flagellar biosynthetic protein FliP [Rhodovulum adriaticum]